MKDQLIKETGLSDNDIQDLREKFLEKYIKTKGWKKDSLTTEQLNEIYQQDEYKRPGLLLS